MKLKFFKTLAIACVLCMTFATLTAFADDNQVITITNYEWSETEDLTADMTIETTVYGVKADDEITYYVAKNNGDIVYIDQATAKGDSVFFTFKAAKNAIYAATAKNGSNKTYTFPTYTFAAGCNYLSKGNATVTQDTVNWAVPNTTYGNQTGYIFQGKVSGAVTEYGITVNGEKLKAQGCDQDGNFVIVLENVDDLEGVTVATYAEPVPAE